MEYWSGKFIEHLKENEIFLYGSNPQGINGAGAAAAAMKLSKGAKHGVGRGLNGSNAYALVTKSLNAGFVEKSTGILYDKEGFRSVSEEQIRANIDELYKYAVGNPEKTFLISYQYESWPNGTPKKSLNGYDSEEMLQMFLRDDIPANIVFHDSYKPHLANRINNKEEAMDTKTEKKEYTFFFHLTSPFSNFHPALFEYKDFTFISNEQFMMFSKAKTFGDEATAQKIIEINNEPLAKDFIDGKISREEIVKDREISAQWQNMMMKAKKLGRGVQNYNEEVWNNRRSKIVLFGARLKFTQNLDLKQILSNTGDTYMVEASRFDPIWSCGLTEYDAKRTPPEQWPGLNLLGKVLDEVKSEFKNEFVKRPKP